VHLRHWGRREGGREGGREGCEKHELDAIKRKMPGGMVRVGGREGGRERHTHLREVDLRERHAVPKVVLDAIGGTAGIEDELEFVVHFRMLPKHVRDGGEQVLGGEREQGGREGGGECWWTKKDIKRQALGRFPPSLPPSLPPSSPCGRVRLASTS